jgi:hypothetical protein
MEKTQAQPITPELTKYLQLRACANHMSEPLTSCNFWRHAAYTRQQVSCFVRDR